MIILLGLRIKQIYYTTVFIQDPLDHDFYVDRSKMFMTPGKCGYLNKPCMVRKVHLGRILSIPRISWKSFNSVSQMLIPVYFSTHINFTLLLWRFLTTLHDSWGNWSTNKTNVRKLKYYLKKNLILLVTLMCHLIEILIMTLLLSGKVASTEN